jgi:hypothetical protein
MNKVVTERPRRGHHNKSLKTGRRLSKDEHPIDYEDHDSGPRSHPISRHRQHGWDAKEFSDLIGPLQRYLAKNVGRPWNKIYSEMSESLDKRTVSGQHIWSHVGWEVELHCEIREDGKVYRKGSRRYASDRPVEGLYVHPVTGLLCEAPTKSWKHVFNRKRWELRRKVTSFGFVLTDAFSELDWIIVDDLTVLQRVNTTWAVHFFVDLSPHDTVEIKTVNGKEVEVKRKDRKNAIFKKRLGFRYIGRRDKELWRLSHDR